jgi:hypothetical protein
LKWKKPQSRVNFLREIALGGFLQQTFPPHKEHKQARKNTIKSSITQIKTKLFLQDVRFTVHVQEVNEKVEQSPQVAFEEAV